MRPLTVRDTVLKRLGDLGCMLAALFIGGLATDAAETIPSAYVAVNELVGLGAIAGLWWRRRRPVPVAAVTFAASAAAPMAGGAAIVAVYTLAAEHRGRWTSSAMSGLYALYLMSGAASLVVFGDKDLGDAGGAVAAIVLTVAAFGWGLAVRSRRELLVALAERAERAEADQVARVAAARRAERLRIAGEMHDVLAHRLSLLSLHAGAVELHPDAPLDERTEAARVVRTNAHLALNDLRAVIGVLRDEHDSALAPEPTLADLDTLIAESRLAGVEVEVEVDNDLPGQAPVPAEIGRHAYHVAREALTNARKHAPGQPVRLAISGRPNIGLQITVTNPAPGSAPAHEAIPGAGVGLLGLRERVELFGGRLHHDQDGDRFQLEAWFPWSA